MTRRDDGNISVKIATMKKKNDEDECKCEYDYKTWLFMHTMGSKFHQKSLDIDLGYRGEHAEFPNTLVLREVLLDLVMGNPKSSLKRGMFG